MMTGLGQKFFGPGNPPILFSGKLRVLGQDGQPALGVKAELVSSGGDVYAVGATDERGIVNFVDVPVHGYKVTSYRIGPIEETALPVQTTTVRLWNLGLGGLDGEPAGPLLVIGGLALAAFIAYYLWNRVGGR